MEFHKIESVTAQEDFVLRVVFAGGQTKFYDAKPIIETREEFEALKTCTGLFSQVRVGPGGYGVIWNDEIDLSCEELYENASG